jgi:NAD(P)-dependent dehydrogenase (short-subunit alcohol dehydrogenase family)
MHPDKFILIYVLIFVTEVHEVVDAVVYLLSDKASMINGVTLPIDGGFLAT